MYNYTSHHIVLISPISPTSTKHFQTDIHHGEINLIKDSAIFFLYLSRTSITVLQKSARGIHVEESCRPVRHALLLCFESPKNERRTTTNHDRDASLFATIRRPVCGASSKRAHRDRDVNHQWRQLPRWLSPRRSPSVTAARALRLIHKTRKIQCGWSNKFSLFLFLLQMLVACFSCKWG